MPVDNPKIQEARYWRPMCNGVQCGLCPFLCFLPEGTRGRCKVRMNHSGRLVTLVHSAPVAVHIDPIEKKPVFHLLPGTGIYSIATAGCNLHCDFCQNWEISQIYPEQASQETIVPRQIQILGHKQGKPILDVKRDKAGTLTPQEVVHAALATGCKSIAYTYSEPIVFFEYMLETAKLAKEKGLKNVMVSAGYINPRPLAELAPYLDVVKIDLKGIDEKFYKQAVGGELRYVLRTLKELKKHNVLTEVVNLVVPTLNDKEEDFKTLSEWVLKNMGPDTPLFFSRFSPHYKRLNLPATPTKTLEKARKIAMDTGLHYVYTGNSPGHAGETTYCPKCQKPLIRRHGYYILKNEMDETGECTYCGTRIPGVWK